MSRKRRKKFSAKQFDRAVKAVQNRRCPAPVRIYVKKPSKEWQPGSPLPQERVEEDFYATQAWRELRYRILKRDGRRCACCGAHASDGISMHVDHIKPRSLYPDLALVASNLQVLCEDCNIGKQNYDSIAWADQIKGGLQ